MSLNKKLIFLFVLVAIAIGFIFYNSLQNSVESNQASDVIEKIIEPIVNKIFGENEIDINYFVRKGAHLTEFFILGFIVMGVVLTVGWKYFGYGLFFVLSVAVTDEYIQSFSDRTSSVKDVLIDFTGAVIGFCICIILFSIGRKIKNILKNKVNSESGMKITKNR